MTSTQSIPGVFGAVQIFANGHFLITTPNMLSLEEIKILQKIAAPKRLSFTECRKLDALALIDEQHEILMNLKLPHFLSPPDPMPDTTRFESNERKMYLANTAKLMNMEALAMYTKEISQDLLKVQSKAVDAFTLESAIKDLEHEATSFHLQKTLDAIFEAGQKMKQATTKKDQLQAVTASLLARNDLARMMQAQHEILCRIQAALKDKSLLEKVQILEAILRPQVDLESLTRPPFLTEQRLLQKWDLSCGACSVVIAEEGSEAINTRLSVLIEN